MACAWAERAIASTSARAGEIAFVQHHMDSLVAVDHLRHPQVGGEAGEGIGLVAVESATRGVTASRSPTTRSERISRADS